MILLVFFMVLFAQSQEAHNSMTSGDTQCHYGFMGGWEYPCICAYDRFIAWSVHYNGTICLSMVECTDNWHCNYPDKCVMGENDVIGYCH
jgi:hypothetical protein